ncbi:putative integral membrane protein [Hirsutella rhossiliensis]
MWYVGDIAIVDRNHGLVLAGFLFTSLASLAVWLRIFTRAVLVRNVGLDDYFICAAMFGTIGFLTAVMHQIRYGLGDQVNPAYLQQFLQSLYATIIAYSFTHLSVKFSILLQCKRIFTEKSAQRIFLGLIIWLTVYGLFCFLSSTLTCVPVAKYWDDSIPGSCIDRSNLHYALAGFNIANDIALLAAPVPYLKGLQIPRRAKIVLMAVFACGGFACIVAIIRLHSLYINNSAPIDQQPVPALKPLFVKFFPRMISSLGESAKRSRTGRSAQGSAPRRDQSGDHDCKASPLEIQVQQSFEMSAVATDADADDDSEKNLVPPNGPVWTAACFAEPRTNLDSRMV